MDEIIRRLREADESGISESDYREIGLLISDYHRDAFSEKADEEVLKLMNRTDAVEDALLAAVYDDAEVDISQCILVLRGHKEPEEADLPRPSLEAYEESIEDTDEEFEELVQELFTVIDGQ